MPDPLLKLMPHPARHTLSTATNAAAGTIRPIRFPRTRTVSRVADARRFLEAEAIVRLISRSSPKRGARHRHPNGAAHRRRRTPARSSSHTRTRPPRPSDLSSRGRVRASLLASRRHRSQSLTVRRCPFRNRRRHIAFSTLRCDREQAGQSRSRVPANGPDADHCSTAEGTVAATLSLTALLRYR